MSKKNIIDCFDKEHGYGIGRRVIIRGQETVVRFDPTTRKPYVWANVVIFDRSRGAFVKAV